MPAIADRAAIIGAGAGAAYGELAGLDLVARAVVDRHARGRVGVGPYIISRRGRGAASWRWPRPRHASRNCPAILPQDDKTVTSPHVRFASFDALSIVKQFSQFYRK